MHALTRSFSFPGPETKYNPLGGVTVQLPRPPQGLAQLTRLNADRVHVSGPTMGTPHPRLGTVPTPGLALSPPQALHPLSLMGTGRGVSGTLAAPHQHGPAAHSTDPGSPPERGPALIV